MGIQHSLDRLREASEAESAAVRMLKTNSVVIAMTKFELEKLVIVMTEGVFHGPDAASEMAARWGE